MTVPWFAARGRIVVGNALASLGVRMKVVAERCEGMGDALIDWANVIDPEATSLARLQRDAAKIRRGKVRCSP